MQLTKPELILFDWDETLADTWEGIRQAVNTTRSHYGLSTWTMEESRFNIRHSMRDTFPAMFGDEWENAARIFKDFIANNHLNFLSEKPGAKNLLDYLQSQNIICGIVSNKMGPTLRREIAHFGWQDYFTSCFISGAEEGPRDKPHPDCIAAFHAHFAKPYKKEIWFIGDSPVDMELANAINATAILIGPHFSASHPALEKCAIDAHVEDCAALQELIAAALQQDAPQAKRA